MPKPAKSESKQDFLGRCSRELISNEGRDSDQAFAMCNAYWDDSKVKASKPLTLTADLEFELAKKEDGSDRSAFMMTAYTGQIMDLGWFGRYIFDLNGMSAKAKIPILREHKRDRVVGHSKKAWAENGNFLISGEFSKATRDAKEVLSLAQEGYPWQASVGISPKKIKTLDSSKESMVVNGQEVSGPIEIWLESKVGEVSFVSLGADDDTAAIALREQPFQEAEAEKPPEGVEAMTLQELQSKHPDIYQEVFALGAASIEMVKLQAEAESKGRMDERDRITKILNAKGDETVTMQAISTGTTVEAAGWMFFEAEKTNRTKKLDDLKTSKPESAGHDAKPSDKDGRGDFVKLRDAYQQEHKCGLGTATSATAKQYPDIHRAWLDSQVQ